MKIPTSEAGQGLGYHPANVVLRLADMVGTLSDCWPEIDDGLVQTLRALEFRPDKDYASKQAGEKLATEELPIAAQRPLAQLKILDKLERQHFWGGKIVSRRTLRNNYCQGVQGFDEAIESLLEEGLLVPGEQRDTFSLNQDLSVKIRDIVIAHRK